MLCESCKKNKANLHYTQVIDGKIQEKHLCEECASKKYKFDFESPFSLDKIFTGLIDNIKEDKKEKEELKCKNCGLTYSEFRREGKFGCSDCYRNFEDNIYPLIKGLHGHNVHRGKIPNNISGDILLIKEEENLKNKLENAVKMENYEEAVVLRDELKVLREKIEEDREG